MSTLDFGQIWQVAIIGSILFNWLLSLVVIPVNANENSGVKRDPLASLRIDRSTQLQTSTVPRRRWILWLVVLLLAAGGGAFWYTQSNSSGNGTFLSWFELPDAIKTRPEVRIARPVVERGRSAEATVVATGYIESRRQAKIGARAPGRVQSVFVEEGSKVQKNQVLAELEHADLDASLNATRASLARSNATIEEQKILISQNRREWQRFETLQTSNSISVSERDTAKYQHDSSVARLESMKADVALAESRLKEAEQLRENMFIRAPFDGTVISKDAEVGESILPGGMGEASGRGSAVTIADLDDLEVQCDVKEDYISRVQSGQSAEVAVDAVPSKRYHAVVRKVIPMGDRARATIKVKVTITDVDANLFPNMSATVYFLPQATNAEPVDDRPRMFCPSEAVVSEDSGDFVWVVDNKGRASRVTITKGTERDGKTEILDGLKGIEKVITKPNGLKQDQSVKVIE